MHTPLLGALDAPNARGGPAGVGGAIVHVVLFGGLSDKQRRDSKTASLTQLSPAIHRARSSASAPLPSACWTSRQSVAHGLRSTVHESPLAGLLPTHRCRGKPTLAMPYHSRNYSISTVSSPSFRSLLCQSIIPVADWLAWTRSWHSASRMDGRMVLPAGQWRHTTVVVPRKAHDQF